MGCCWTNAPEDLLGYAELELLLQSAKACDPGYEPTFTELVNGGFQGLPGTLLDRMEAGFWVLIRQAADPLYDPNDEQLSVSPNDYRDYLEALCSMVNGALGGYDCDFDAVLASSIATGSSEWMLQAARVTLLQEIARCLSGDPSLDGDDALSTWNNPGPARSVIHKIISEDGGFEFCPRPLAPTNLIATPISFHEVDLVWTDNATNEIGYSVERRQGAGDYEVIALLDPNTTSYSDEWLDTLTQYTYRVRALSGDGCDSSYSNEASVTTLDFEAPDGATLLLMASAIPAVSDGTPMDQWDDVGPEGNHATKLSDPTRPLYSAAGFHGMPAVAFTAASLHNFAVPSTIVVGGQTAAEMFILMRTEVYPNSGPTVAGYLNFANEIPTLGHNNLVGFSDNFTYVGFFGTTRPQLPAVRTDGWMIINDRATSGSRIVTHNGVAWYSSGSHTFTTGVSGSGMGTLRRLGRSGDTANYLNGKIAFVLLCDHILTSQEREYVMTYLLKLGRFIAEEGFNGIGYSNGLAIPASMTGGRNWDGAPDIAENFIRILGEEPFESYAVGIPASLDGGTGWVEEEPSVVTNVV